MNRAFVLVCAALWTVPLWPQPLQPPVAIIAATSSGHSTVAHDCPEHVNPAIPRHFVTLVSGAVLCSSTQTPVSGKHTTLELTIVGVSQDYVPQVWSAVGNHAQVLHEEKVGTPVGAATLALVERTLPAASRNKTPSYEYWLVTWRPHPERTDMGLAYAIRAAIVGQPDAARQEVLDLAKTWRIEGETAAPTS
jgi:hypothetical protein